MEKNIQIHLTMRYKWIVYEKKRYGRRKEMSKYFKKALSDFTFDVASGGAIRHLADSGYTVKQIVEHLSFPTSYEKVQKTVWDYLLDKGVLLLEEPGSEQREKVDYIKEYDSFGKPSFRRIVCSDKSTIVSWKEMEYKEKENGKLREYLFLQCNRNGEESAYVSCDFGLRCKRESKQFEEDIRLLEERQRDYILGVFCEKKLVYHRLNPVMREIIVRLYEEDRYHGYFYFEKIGEKVKI